MECPKCHAKVSVKAKFCEQCGVNLADSADFIHQKALENYHRGLIDEAISLWNQALEVLIDEE